MKNKTIALLLALAVSAFAQAQSVPPAKQTPEAKPPAQADLDALRGQVANLQAALAQDEATIEVLGKKWNEAAVAGIKDEAQIAVLKAQQPKPSKP